MEVKSALISGEAKLGFVNKGKLARRRLKMGDVYQIPAGSAFYIVNIEGDQKLHIICSIEPSESLGDDVFQVHGSIIMENCLLMLKKKIMPFI